MKYTGMPQGMWLLYKRSFQNHLASVLGYGNQEAKTISANAKPKYKEIISKLPEFEKADRFKMNIVNCALLCAFVLNMKVKPSVDELTEFYAQSMMNRPTIWLKSY